MRWHAALAPSLLTAGIAAALALPPAFAATPSGNLLANPDAEVPPTFSGGGIASSPAGWTAQTTPDPTTERPYASCYGGSDAERTVIPKDVGAAIAGGSRFFFAGKNDQAALTQEIAVTPADVVGKTLLVGGFFGGFSSQGDSAQLAVQFLDATSAPLGPAVGTAPVTAADRAEATALVQRSATGVVPAGTARLRVALTMTRTDGSDNDGYADSLYVTFDATAPPRAAAPGDGVCTSSSPPPATTTTTTPPPTTPPTTTTTPPPPKLPGLAAAVTGLPSSKRCVSRRSFKIRLRNPAQTTIARASVKVNGKQVATRSGARVTAPVNLKGLPKGRYTVKITVTLTDGRTITGTRRYRTCAPKRGR